MSGSSRDLTSDLVSRLRTMYAEPARNHEHWLKEAADEIDRLQRHGMRRRDSLSIELEMALDEWKNAGAPVERVVIAIGNLVQHGIDFVIAEFDEDEKP